MEPPTYRHSLDPSTTSRQHYAVKTPFGSSPQEPTIAVTRSNRTQDRIRESLPYRANAINQTGKDEFADMSILQNALTAAQDLGSVCTKAVC